MLCAADRIFQVKRNGYTFRKCSYHVEVFFEVDHALTKRHILSLPTPFILCPYKVFDVERVDMRLYIFKTQGPRHSTFEGRMTDIILASHPRVIEIVQNSGDVPYRRTDT